MVDETVYQVLAIKYAGLDSLFVYQVLSRFIVLLEPGQFLLEEFDQISPYCLFSHVVPLL